MDTGDSRNGLSERNMFLASISITQPGCRAPSCLPQQHRAVDGTEIQRQFTWQFNAAYSHMTTH